MNVIHTNTAICDQFAPHAATQPDMRPRARG